MESHGAVSISTVEKSLSVFPDLGKFKCGRKINLSSSVAFIISSLPALDYSRASHQNALHTDVLKCVRQTGARDEMVLYAYLIHY